jgi:hypothetical protein
MIAEIPGVPAVLGGELGAPPIARDHARHRITEDRAGDHAPNYRDDGESMITVVSVVRTCGPATARAS